jgi:hypothetical protein
MSNEKITLEEELIFHDYESFVNKMLEVLDIKERI